MNNNRVVERTIAHELGHGFGSMSHTFNAKYGTIPEGTTNNLMDYGDGIAMQKLQWDALHSKVEVWKVFERDKDGMQKKIPIKTADEQSIFLAAQLFKEYIVDQNLKPKDFNYQNLSSDKKYEFLRRYEQGKTADVFRTMSDNQHYLEHRQGEEQIYANFIYELFDRITTVESLIEIPFYQEKLVQALKGEYLQEIFAPDITITILSLGVSNSWKPHRYFTNNNGKWISTSRGKITPDDFEKVVAKLEGKGAGAVGVNTGTKLLPQFASSTIDDAVSYAMRTQNNINHIFASKHNLSQLVSKLGGQQNTIRAALNAGNGMFPSSGVFKFPVNVGGQSVWIKGIVENGIPKLETMWIP